MTEQKITDGSQAISASIGSALEAFILVQATIERETLIRAQRSVNLAMDLIRNKRAKEAKADR